MANWRRNMPALGMPRHGKIWSMARIAALVQKGTLNRTLKAAGPRTYYTTGATRCWSCSRNLALRVNDR